LVGEIIEERKFKGRTGKRGENTRMTPLSGVSPKAKAYKIFQVESNRQA